jgi:hypothetical protein
LVTGGSSSSRPKAARRQKKGKSESSAGQKKSTRPEVFEWGTNPDKVLLQVMRKQSRNPEQDPGFNSTKMKIK